MKSLPIFLSIIVLCSGCRKMEDPLVEAKNYFPSITTDEWASTTPAEYDWDEDALPDLYELLEAGDTRAFIVLKEGKIVIEKYWNETLLGQPFTAQSNWYWASAGKALTSLLVGQAAAEGKIDIKNPSNTYLGSGWSSLTEDQEDKITVQDHLSMTTGLDDTSVDIFCTDPECLRFLAEPGTRWAYHNGPYTLLDQVIEGGTGEEFEAFFESRLKDKIGMDGFWNYQGYNHLYYSTARSMARFALLVLNEGIWSDEVVLHNADYLEASITSSQDINPSYGYLWWLNGKSKLMLPQVPLAINQSLSQSAPADMYAAMGKNGQFINIVPSENMVVIRMGGYPDESLVPTIFQDEIWQQLSKVMKE